MQEQARKENGVQKSRSQVIQQSAVKSPGKTAWKKAAEQAGRGHRNACWQASPTPWSAGGDSPGCFRDLFGDLHNQNKKKGKMARRG